MNTFETSKDVIDCQNCQTDSNMVLEELRENVQQSLIPFSSCKIVTNELASVMEDKISNESLLISTYFQQKNRNTPTENTLSKSIICNNIAKLNGPLMKENRYSDCQPYQIHKENNVGILSALSSTSIRLMDNDIENCNSSSYMENVINSGTNIASGTHYFDHSNAITLLTTCQHSLQLHNVRGSFMNINMKESSLIGKKGVAITEECFQKQKSVSNWDAEWSTYSFAESVLSSTNSLLVNPEMNIDIKEKFKNSISQRKNFNFQAFKKYNKQNQQIFSDVIEKHDCINRTEFLQIQQGNMSNKLDLGSTCSTVDNSILVQDNVSIHLAMNSEEGYFQKMLFNSSNLKYKQLLDTKVGLRLVKSICSWNIFNKLVETLSDKESVENSQALMNHKLLISNTLVTNCIEIIKNSLTSFSKHIKVDETITSAPQNEIIKQLTDSESTELKSCEINRVVPKKCTFIRGNFSDVTFNHNSNIEFKSSNQILLKEITNRFPQGVSFLADVSEVNENKFSSSKGKTSINFNGELTHKNHVFDSLSNTYAFVESNPCDFIQLKEQIYPGSAYLSQLRGHCKQFSSQKVSNKTVELSQRLLNDYDLPRQGALACSNKETCDTFEKIEHADVYECQNLSNIGLSKFLLSDELNKSDSNKITFGNTIQFDVKTTNTGDFDAEIDKAIDQSMDKFENFMCDKGVVATPDTSEKSSQTDTGLRERQLTCKRCLEFDREECTQSKRIKAHHNSEASSFLNCEQVSTSLITEPMSYGTKRDSSSNLTSIYNDGDSNEVNDFNGDLTRCNMNKLQTPSKDSSLAISQDMTIDNRNKCTLFCENIDVNNDEFSLYDEDMDIEDEFHCSKGSKNIFESKRVLSDHKVPVADEEVVRTTLIKSPSFTKPLKKPALKVGLSKSARLKPLHQK